MVTLPKYTFTPGSFVSSPPDTRNNPVVSDLLLPADVSYTQETFETDGVGSDVTTTQHCAQVESAGK